MFVSTAELTVAGSSSWCRQVAAALHNNSLGLWDVKHPEFMCRRLNSPVTPRKSEATHCFFSMSRLLHYVITCVCVCFSWGEWFKLFPRGLCLCVCVCGDWKQLASASWFAVNPSLVWLVLSSCSLVLSSFVSPFSCFKHLYQQLQHCYLCICYRLTT